MNIKLRKWIHVSKANNICMVIDLKTAQKIRYVFIRRKNLNDTGL